MIRIFIRSDFYVERHHVFGNQSTIPLSVLSPHLGALELRNSRLNLRRLSLHADLLKQRAAGAPISFTSLAQADIVMFLEMRRKGEHWWPHTGVHLTRSYLTLPIFARASSTAYFERLRPIIGHDSVEGFRARVTQLDDSGLRWDWDRLSLKQLTNIDELCTSE